MQGIMRNTSTETAVPVLAGQRDPRIYVTFKHRQIYDIRRVEHSSSAVYPASSGSVLYAWLL